MVLTIKSILLWGVEFAFLSTSVALQCFKCGQYNDGVGSITPCINDTYMKLINCPNREINYCIKYVSEGTVVRDCVAKCTEKDNWDWNSRTFCCQDDACNSANRPQQFSIILPMALCLGLLLRQFVNNGFNGKYH